MLSLSAKDLPRGRRPRCSRSLGRAICSQASAKTLISLPWVERHSRFVMLIKGTQQRYRDGRRRAKQARAQTPCSSAARSLTWDRGHEMAKRKSFTVDTNVKVYFCDPLSPWQRGSNENTNGLLRQYFPKKTLTCPVLLSSPSQQDRPASQSTPARDLGLSNSGE